MWRRVMQKVIDPFLLRIARRADMLIKADEASRILNARRWATLSPTVKIHPSAEIRNYLGDPKAITIGAHSHINGQLFVFWNGGNINIGEWSHIGDGSRIWSQASISIGNHVLISYLVDIHDTNGHPIDWEERRLDEQELMAGKYRIPTKTVSKPIIIEDDVWIGFKATVLKGVHIGRGAIITAGSVVAEDVPAWTVLAGNPARVIRELKGIETS
jgi:acetyltransferase-like isoleucine patch superfamily enzyme